ncbi:zinc transporter ZitB [Maritalea myrionectae]|uniref:Zinc transporter ZitB n=1 Tax=Maritalea myrionectae TaxID=454601 RepID=A0A2R4MBU2_9HYPH|nr:cation diffusion facilitator family transporter [Maritalea myrionectae]AVX03414.1 zinc transporter ZitB [Maritalea myrionectae]
MGHHHHHHVDPNDGDAKVLWAILVNMGLTVAQIVGGIFAGSLALIADALHNFSDAISLIIAFLARKIARRPADKSMTFGYGRAEVVAALINYTTLIVIGLYLAYEAVMRFFDPQPVDGWLIVIIAGIALVVDVITALLTFALSKTSVNIRAAFLHNVADALGSVAVIFAGTLILLYDWRLIDPAVTLLIAGYILWQSFAEIGGVIRILMLGAPEEVDLDAVIELMRNADGVRDVHHVHFWRMQEHQSALSAHLVLDINDVEAAGWVRDALKKQLHDQFDIVHVTLEIEAHNEPCTDPQLIGHQDAGA